MLIVIQGPNSEQMETQNYLASLWSTQDQR